jgi:hypothetical protein
LTLLAHLKFHILFYLVKARAALASTGRSEERDFAKMLGDYQTAHYKRPLQKLMTYIMLSKSGPTKGQMPESWRIHFQRFV